MKKIDLSIIIVSYNTKELLIECVCSIVETIRKVSYEIVVVDNGSRDGTVKEISKMKYQRSNIKIRKNQENLGFSKANNIGVKQAEGRHLLFLNPDTVVYEKTIDGVVEFMDQHKDVGAATCFVELPSGQLDDASHRGFPTPWRAFSHFSGLSKLFPRSKLFAGYSLGWMNLDTTHEIDSCAGAFMIVRRAAGEKVGWWDEDYFWYGEDLDFCYRLKNGLSLRAKRSNLGLDEIATSSLGKLGTPRNDNKKWKIYFVPQYRILHYKGVSGGIKKHSKHISTADKETQLRATRARFEAMKIFYKKHYKDKYPAIVNWLVNAGINTKLLLARKFKRE